MIVDELIRCSMALEIIFKYKMFLFDSIEKRTVIIFKIVITLINEVLNK